MRIVPVGIYFSQDFEISALVKAVAHLVYPTHQSNVAIAGAAAIAGAVAQAMLPNSSSELIIETAIKAAKKGEKMGYQISSPSVSRRLQWTVDYIQSFKSPEEGLDDLVDLLGNGMNVVEAVPFVFAALIAYEFNPFKTIIGIINRGGDADSIAAMAGGIAGAHRGQSTCPVDIRTIIQKEALRQASFAPRFSHFLPTEERLLKVAKNLVKHRKREISIIDF